MSDNSVELKDRVLWFDGDSTVSEQYIVDAITKGKPIGGLFIDEITDEIEKYNKFADDPITVKSNVRENKLEWVLPEEFQEINIEEYIAEKFFWESKCNNLSIEDHELRIARIREELQLYEKLNLFQVLRTLIYIINTLHDNNIVWGVGRGSSVSSYILYLIGVHDVDSVAFDLDITEFLRTE